MSIDRTGHTLHGPRGEVFGVYETFEDARVVLDLELAAAYGPPAAPTDPI